VTSAAPAAPVGTGSARLAARFVAPTVSLPVWLALWVAVVGCEILAMRPLFEGGSIHPVYVIFRLVGGSFAVCGLIVWRTRPDSRSGALMTGTGFAFFLGPLLGQVTVPVVQAVGQALLDLWLLFFLPLVLTLLTGGRLRTRFDRAIVGVLAVAVLVLAPAEWLFREAPGNPMAVHPDERLATIAATAGRALAVLAFTAAIAVVAVRFRAASGPGRRALLPAVAGAVCLALFAALIIRDRLQGTVTVQALDWIAVFSILTVPLAFLGGLLRSRLARGGLADLFRRIHDLPPAELQATLARVTGDPDLTVAYREPDDRYVDAMSRPVAVPPAGADRAVAAVTRDGERVAVLVYDRSLDDDPELVDAVTAAATVALDTRHLRAQAQERLAELRASRERILTVGDAERRRIERNLHDGAQQRLVALTLQLSLIQRRIRDDPDAAERLVTAAGDELARSLAELRELARGIHPSTLDHGLDIALEGLAVRSAVPTTVEVEPGPALPEPIAFAAYLVTAEALTNVARHARATSASVRVTREPGRLVVEVTDDGGGGADMSAGTGLRGLADRVEALDGTLHLGDSPTGGTVLMARLPVEP
jgi:signal transduction histidine kinase